jgi:hypothetical protein
VVFTPVTVKNAVFWDVTPCGSIRTDVSEELTAPIMRMTRIGELETALALTSNRRMLRKKSKVLVNYVRFEGFTPVTMKNGADDIGAKFLRNVGYYNMHTP